MTALEELEALAKSAIPGPWKATRAHEDFNGPMWDLDEDEAIEYKSRPYTGIESKSARVAAAHELFRFDRNTAEYIAKANPDAILALIALARQQHEQLRLNTINLRNGMSRSIQNLQARENCEALAAFENFGKG